MDLAALVAATARSTRPEGDGHLVVLERRFAAAPEAVWAALTEPERLAAWFEPAEIQGDRYRLEGSGTSGTVLACEPATLLRLSWEYDGEASTVSISLRADGPTTQLRLAHAADDDEHWEEFGPGATGVGWDGSLLALARHLGDAAPEPDGPAYVRAAATAWERAHRASGASAVVAKTAAAKVAAFYTAG